MKSIVVILLAILLGGCTSSRVTLSTHQPGKTEYELSFGWMLVNQAHKEDLNLKEREEEYEKIINNSLKNDPNTKECSVIKDSFRYFEPGCCAAARVSCENPIKFEEIHGIYNSAGMPKHIYTIKK